jgi:hypothetical protein
MKNLETVKVKASQQKCIQNPSIEQYWISLWWKLYMYIIQQKFA